jgi:UDP-N-acetylmuramoyl-tripeptide--D-alanyl-D-alanine ligase
VACPQIIVANTTLALGLLAKYWREQFAIPIVGITGSCGKTTTTQMTGAILRQIGPTLVPIGNKNNQFGVPLTLFNLNAGHQYAVIEMGADRGGEIKYLANIVQPTVSIITLVAPVHLQVTEGIGFGSLDGVYQEKTEIYKVLQDAGIAIVNRDDAFYPKWHELLRDKKVITFGYTPDADVHATDFIANADFRYTFNLMVHDQCVSITLSSLGKHNIMNALAASAAAIALDVPLAAIQAGLSNVPLVARRMNRFNTLEGATIIDDSYNSNLRSAKAIIEMLAEHTGRKIAILGDMREIGTQSAEFHQAIGEYAKAQDIDYLYAFGPESTYTANAFGDKAQHFVEVEPLLQAVKPLLDATTLVIVKGSLGMGMDRIVKGLIAVT